MRNLPVCVVVVCECAALCAHKYMMCALCVCVCVLTVLLRLCALCVCVCVCVAGAGCGEFAVHGARDLRIGGDVRAARVVVRSAAHITRAALGVCVANDRPDSSASAAGDTTAVLPRGYNGLCGDI